MGCACKRNSGLQQVGESSPAARALTPGKTKASGSQGKEARNANANSACQPHSPALKKLAAGNASTFAQVAWYTCVVKQKVRCAT